MIGLISSLRTVICFERNVLWVCKTSQDEKSMGNLTVIPSYNNKITREFCKHSYFIRTILGLSSSLQISYDFIKLSVTCTFHLRRRQALIIVAWELQIRLHTESQLPASRNYVYLSHKTFFPKSTHSNEVTRFGYYKHTHVSRAIKCLHQPCLGQ